MTVPHRRVTDKAFFSHSGSETEPRRGQVKPFRHCSLPKVVTPNAISNALEGLQHLEAEVDHPPRDNGEVFV